MILTQQLMNFAQEHMLAHIVIIVVSAAAMIIAMAVDLFFGIKKAKELGQARTSTGFKKSCEKAKKYFAPFLTLMCIDLISCVILPVPAFCMLWAAYCVFCEFTSVREHAWQKEELRKAERTVSVILENKDDIAKLVAKMLFEKQENENNSTN